ncbi:MAG TPA: transporter substrate-binding domain-containing protein, partial [Spirochaetota bacterium]|nr:transporter substrate-binding domain-containing protein [Spirochaetota bacterium]
MNICNGNFKKIFIFLFILLTYFAFSEEAKRVVRVGFYENPPKLFKDENGKITGYHIDIIKGIAKNENWDLQFVEGSWDEGLLRLKKGE